MLDWLMALFNKFGNALIQVLPHSPFIKFIRALDNSQYIQYVNWFLPIHNFLLITTAWLTAIGTYYAYRIVAKWIKLMD